MEICFAKKGGCAGGEYWGTLNFDLVGLDDRSYL
jgi:hypothetical protein